MALPASLSVITLKGSYFKSNGDPEAGALVKIYSDEFIQSGDSCVGPLNYDTELNDAGYLEIPVVATNDPQWVPINFTYLIKIALSSGVRSFRLSVPFDAPAGIINLPGATPTVDGPDPSLYVMLNQANQDGGFAQIDPTTHKISPSVIPAGGGDADGAFRGTYSGAAVYIAGDTVIYSSVTYGALQGSTNKTPDGNPSFWQAYPDASGGGGGAVSSVFGRTGDVVGAKADVGLSNVDNTADVSKPISTATATALGDKADATAVSIALGLKAPIASPTFTGTVNGITKSMVGLSGVDNTADTAKPVSTAQQTALNLKADLAGPTFTGTVGGITKSMVGLGSVDNTSDVNKPVSTAQSAAFQPLDSDLTAIASLTATTNNMIQSVGSAWASRTPAQVKTALAIAESDVTNLVADLAAKAPLASPSFTGTATVGGRSVCTPTALTDAATIVVDAALSNDFTVTLGGNRTLGNPSNATNGQRILFAIRQDGTGTRTLTLGSAYRLGTDITSVTLSTAINKTDYLGVRYNGTDSKWDVIAFVKGY